MKIVLSAALRGLLVSAFVIMTPAVPALRADDALPAVAKPKVTAAVTVSDNGSDWILDNGVVKATINKRSSNMTALVFRGINTMRGGGYWEQRPSGRVTQTVTIDPAKNGGERAEVSIKGVTGGSGFDIEARYTMARGESGIHVYGIFSHPANYGAAREGESRYITKLNHDFNWISVDADRNLLECTPQDWGAGP